MPNNMLNKKIIGKCSICGGMVTIPTIHWSVIPPVPSCEKCGAIMDEARDLPEVPMIPYHKTN